jgi:hypothetical protein
LAFPTCQVNSSSDQYNVAPKTLTLAIDKVSGGSLVALTGGELSATYPTTLYYTGSVLVINQSGIPLITETGSGANLGVSITPTGTGTTTIGNMIPQFASTTVGALPGCNGSTEYQEYAVTDASSPTWNATLTGGSTSVVLAFCNGTNWTAH